MSSLLRTLAVTQIKSLGDSFITYLNKLLIASISMHTGGLNMEKSAMDQNNKMYMTKLH